MKEGAGDLWTWTALDAETKLIPCRFVGQRDAGCAYHFIHDLKARLANRVQLTTDGHRAHLTTVEDAFGAEINYAMLQKIYGTTRSTTDQKSEIRGQTSAFPPSLYHPQPLPRARVREALRHAAADLRELSRS